MIKHGIIYEYTDVYVKWNCVKIKLSPGDYNRKSTKNTIYRQCIHILHALISIFLCIIFSFNTILGTAVEPLLIERQM